MGHLAHELSHELLHVDGKVWRTAKALFLEPGRLTAEYWAGRRAGWIGPFRVFLIAAAAMVLFVPGIGPLNLQTELVRNQAGGFDVSIGAPRVRPAGSAPLVKGPEYDNYVARLRTMYSAVRYLAVPLFAAATWLLYRRRQPYYAAHVVLAVHFYAFWYTASLVTARLPYRAGVFTVLSLSGFYLFRALRALFGETWLRTALKALVLYAAMVTLESLMALAAGAWVARG